MTRAVLVGGAVWLGGHVMRALPHDQVLLFPIGSAFPNAIRFSASWKRSGDRESSGGISLTFDRDPPLQIRRHVSLPNGDYVVNLNILESPRDSQTKSELGERREGRETNIERRVSLSGGEARIALAAGGF